CSHINTASKPSCQNNIRIKMSCFRFLAVVASAFTLGAVLLTYPKPSAFPPPPVQEISPITGFPTWREHIKGFDFQTNETPVLYALIVDFILGLSALYWTLFYKQPKSTVSFFHHDSETAPATLFNTIIAIYILVTSWAPLASLIVDLSKLWVPVGVFHNAAELMFLWLLFTGGKVASNFYFPAIGIYMITVVATCMYAPWPYDAVFFKAQGLVLDFMIIIVFTQIILETRSRFKEDAESHTPIADLEDEEDRERLTSRAKLYPTTVDHPKQLYILLAAGIFHILGNAIGTIFSDSFKA
ncbi:13885_t:CDS:2, partial [Ambispora leptoticha]